MVHNDALEDIGDEKVALVVSGEKDGPVWRECKP